jgi:chemotaxis protein MotB
MPRREADAEGEGGGHDNAGSMRWLLTYADMITLLMAFFIMMYSMSVLNIQKFREVAFSIRSGFGGPIDGGGAGMLAFPQANDNIAPSIDDLVESSGLGALPGAAKQIEEYIKEQGLGEIVRMRVEKRGLVVSLVTDQVLFDIGRAELRPRAKHILSKVGAIVRNMPNEIAVEGHTCDLPIRTQQFPSNWELSTARATTVVRFLIDHAGIAPRRVSASGYADSRPLAPNDSEARRVSNRRVDIVILSNGMRDIPQRLRDEPRVGNI